MPKTAKSSTRPPRSTRSSKKDEPMTLRNLFEMKLKSLYDVENQLTKALPKMAKRSEDEDLRSGFEKHDQQTKHQVERLENVFDIMGAKPQKQNNGAIRGLVADAEFIMKNVKGGPALDAALIAAAEGVEHYEIACYQSAIAWAKLLDMDDAADILQETLDEEHETSQELTDLATGKVDERAMPHEIEMDEGKKNEEEEDKEDEDDEDDDEDESEKESEAY